MRFCENSHNLTALRATLDELCSALDIEPFTPEHEEVERVLMSFYRRGATTPEALASALAEWTRQADGRHDRL